MCGYWAVSDGEEEFSPIDSGQSKATSVGMKFIWVWDA